MSIPSEHRAVDNPRKYGQPPFRIAVIHGGPGSPGEMAPVARELARDGGVLEPLQTADSVDGQVEELHTLLDGHAELPLILIGHSWGAWLSFILAAEFPTMVKKLILIGSGAFEEKYNRGMHALRLSRLSEMEWQEVESLHESFANPETRASHEAFARFGELFSRADAYDPIPHESEVVEYQADVFRSVWGLAASMRKSGELLVLAERIECPVVAIHGDYDPHPVDGVRIPLSTVLKDFRFITLEKCGHIPWIERWAKEEFYRVLRAELD